MPTDRDDQKRQRLARNALLQLLRGFEVDDLRRIAFDLLDPDLVYDLPEGAISRNEVIYAILDWRERRMGPSSTDVDALLNKLDDDLTQQRKLLDDVARKWAIQLPSWGPARAAEPQDEAAHEAAQPAEDEAEAAPDRPVGLPRADLLDFSPAEEFLSEPDEPEEDTAETAPPTDTDAVAAFLQAYERQAYELSRIESISRSKGSYYPRLSALSQAQLKAALDELVERGDVREVEGGKSGTRYTWDR